LDSGRERSLVEPYKLIVVARTSMRGRAELVVGFQRAKDVVQKMGLFSFLQGLVRGS